MRKVSLKDITDILTNIQDTFIVNKKNSYSKFYTSLALVATDVISVVVSFLLSVFISYGLFIDSPGVLYSDILSTLRNIIFIFPFFPIVYSFLGLYPAYGIDQVREFRKMTLSITFVFAGLFVSNIVLKNTFAYSTIIFVLAYFFALVLSLPLRIFTKKILSKYDWWGVPVMIIGAGGAGTRLIRSLKKQNELGLTPVLAIDDDADKWGYIDEVPVVGGLDIVPALAEKLDIHHAIIAMPTVPAKFQTRIAEEYSHYFSNLTVIPEMYTSSLWVSSRDIGGLLGLDVQIELLKKTSQFKKRLFDIIASLILIIITAPIQILVAVLIKLDSKGPVLFKQERCGKNNTRFDIFKFRSMQVYAEERLKEVLNSNDKLREEFEIYHKIDNDPRLTKMGRFIRKYSLDELPQFFNVLKGDMSLIGPRAYLPWELYKIDEFILEIKPGVSGLWQVTDRDSSFEDRVITDLHYIRNWSFSLDCVLIGKTVNAILKGTGS